MRTQEIFIKAYFSHWRRWRGSVFPFQRLLKFRLPLTAIQFPAKTLISKFHRTAPTIAAGFLSTYGKKRCVSDTNERGFFLLKKDKRTLYLVGTKEISSSIWLGGFSMPFFIFTDSRSEFTLRSSIIFFQLRKDSLPIQKAGWFL